MQQYYRPADNFPRVQRIQYILKYSLAKTLAGKHKGKIANFMSGIEKDIKVEVNRKNGSRREVKFYLNHDWTGQRDAFSKSPKVDIVRMNVRLRTRSKLGLPCVICGDEENIQMHHVRHIRKMSEKQARGFTRVMMALNRKQLPVCERCHKQIHKGSYDGISLKELAYDPRGVSYARPPKVNRKQNEFLCEPGQIANGDEVARD
jgi:hypothetical protein